MRRLEIAWAITLSRFVMSSLLSTHVESDMLSPEKDRFL